ncbi:DUF397 domain-containing protein [Actinomadura viridis]|uniref:DUF397 domain-containing protein n=1 Tax=Actinomadura viridis TaxID=58110 RepID=A0A931DPL1_9ACTN|nr:DUF397 domain-containing protein [Actinomadura viridis]MBG6093760.1 hypothetical protein [Actinomadura viridis]
MNEFSNARWRKSSHSHAGSGDCVEVAPVPGSVGMRDSKDPSGPVLLVARTGMSALLADIRAGRYDR